MTDLFPTAPKTDPREKRCATCGGPNAHCGIGGLWLCVRCVPADFYPAKREATPE